MRKLDLTNYQWTEPVRNPVEGQPTEFTLPYLVKDSLINIMFLPSLGLRGAEAIKQEMLAMRILNAGDSILLEEEEFERIKRAIENYPVEKRADVPLIDRILNQTPEVKVDEKPNSEAGQEA